MRLQGSKTYKLLWISEKEKVSCGRKIRSMSINYQNSMSVSKFFCATEVDQQSQTDGAKAPEPYFCSSLCFYQKKKKIVPDN